MGNLNRYCPDTSQETATGDQKPAGMTTIPMVKYTTIRTICKNGKDRRHISKDERPTGMTTYPTHTHTHIYIYVHK